MDKETKIPERVWINVTFVGDSAPCGGGWKLVPDGVHDEHLYVPAASLERAVREARAQGRIDVLRECEETAAKLGKMFILGDVRITGFKEWREAEEAKAQSARENKGEV